MNLLFKNIGARLSGVFKKKGSFHLGRNPTLDWLFILVSSILVALVMVGLSIFHYGGFGPADDGELSNGDEKDGLLSDELVRRVDDAYDAYEARRLRLEQILDEPVTVVAPSR